MIHTGFLFTPTPSLTYMFSTTFRFSSTNIHSLILLLPYVLISPILVSRSNCLVDVTARNILSAHPGWSHLICVALAARYKPRSLIQTFFQFSLIYRKRQDTHFHQILHKYSHNVMQFETDYILRWNLPIFRTFVLTGVQVICMPVVHGIHVTISHLPPSSMC